MHRQRALFQLGMDLDAYSSTTQTEEQTIENGLAIAEKRKDYFQERDGVRYAGTHLILDLYGAKRIDDLAHVEAALRECVAAAGATLLHIHLHHFTPSLGVSGVAVLAESHISIHTWPECGYAALDVFTCGDTRPEATVEVLRRAFSPERLVVSEHLRGRVL